MYLFHSLQLDCEGQGQWYWFKRLLVMIIHKIIQEVSTWLSCCGPSFQTLVPHLILRALWSYLWAQKAEYSPKYCRCGPKPCLPKQDNLSQSRLFTFKCHNLRILDIFWIIILARYIFCKYFSQLMLIFLSSFYPEVIILVFSKHNTYTYISFSLSTYL